jgi:hypothetical protein
MSGDFPKRSPLFGGCVLGALLNTLTYLDHGGTIERFFLGNRYGYNGGDGNHFALAFDGDAVVGALFDHDSERSPFRCEGAYDAERFFVGVPSSHRSLVEQACCWRHKASCW